MPFDDPQQDGLRRRDLERFARWLGADADTAAELAQTALVRLWQAPPVVGSELATAGWLRAVVRNEFLADSRQRRRSGVPIDDLTLLEAAWRRFARDDAGDSRMAASRAAHHRPGTTAAAGSFALVGRDRPDRAMLRYGPKAAVRTGYACSSRKRSIRARSALQPHRLAARNNPIG